MDASTKKVLGRSASLLALTALVVSAAPAPAGAQVAASTTGISVARAEKLARAGVLTAKDLKGWTLVPDTGTTETGTSTDTGSTQCGKAIKYLAGDGAMFSKGLTVLVSSAAVAAAPADAKADFKTLQSATAIGCLRSSILAGTSGDGMSTVSVKRVTAKVSGADQSTGFRVITAGKVNGRTIKVDGYLLAARVGRTELTVYTASGNAKAPSLAKTIGYLKKVAGRVHAA